MIASVTEINITNIAVQKLSHSYSVTVYWTTRQSKGDPYTGPYSIELWTIDAKKASVSVDQGEYGVISDKNMDWSFDTNERYTICVSEPTGTATCKPVPLLLQTFASVTGEYDGSTLTLQWDRPENGITGGLCSLASARGELYAWTFAQRVRHFSTAVSPQDFDAEDVWTVRLTPQAEAVSSGPESAEAVFYNTPLSLRSANVEEQGNGKVRLTASFTSPYQPQSRMKVQLVLIQNGKICHSFSKVPLPEEKEGVYTLSEELEAGLGFSIHDCELAVTLCTENTRCAIETDQNRVPLMQITWESLDCSEKATHLSWRIGGEKPSSYVLRQSGHPDRIVEEDRITLSAGGAQGIDQLYTIAPRYGTRRGPFSEAKTAFVPGYYPDGDGVAYRNTKYESKKIVLPLDSSLFQEALEQGISVGPLSVSKTPDCQLTIDTAALLTRDDYGAFLAALEQSKITARGMYLVQNQIVRTALFRPEETLFLYCNLNETARCADLRPGMTLRVQSEQYMPQYDPDTDDTAGFVLSGSADFHISERRLDQDIILEFDSFFDRFADAMYEGAPASGTILGSGLPDLFLKRVRRAFVRMLYPAGFPDSAEFGSPHEADNVVLLAADTRSGLSSKTDVVKLILRGRSVLTLCITVWSNGKEAIVPVGTTLGGLLLRQTGSDTIPAGTRLWRMTAFSRYAPVRLDWMSQEQRKELPLLGGDKIEVCVG